MKREKRLLIIQNGLIYFFMCACIGWILEVIYAYFVLGTFVNRGFLYGPICPIYGLGAVMMITIAEAMKKKKVKTIILKFIIITILFSALEYIGSLLLEVLLGIRLWDYSTEFLNLNGRICLIFSLLFGIMGIFFTQCVYEPTKNIIRKIRHNVPDKIIWIISGTLIIIMSIDMFFSVIKYLN